MNNYKKYSYILSGIYLLNIVLLLVISIGFLQNNAMAKVYFLLSYTLIPLALLIGTIVLQYFAYKKEELDLNLYLNKWYTHNHFISTMVIIIIFTIKFAIQLDKMVLAEVITLGITFALAQLMMLFIYKKKEFNFKRSVRLFITSFFLYAFYIALIIVLTYDYSVII